MHIISVDQHLQTLQRSHRFLLQDIILIMNDNNVMNFNVLESDYIKVCIDHVNFNSISNFDAEIMSFKL